MRNILSTFEKYKISGCWHIHTRYTDGKNTIDEYCKKAVELNIPLLCFTEHVRRSLSYNFASYIEDIENAKRKYKNLLIVKGCETKVLPDGSLDCEENVLKKCEFILFSYHSFPSDAILFLKTLRKVIRNRYVNAWAHPGFFFIKNKDLKLKKYDLESIYRLMHRYGIALEINLRYDLPPKEWRDIYIKLGFNNFINGPDVHSIEELISFSTKKLPKDIIHVL